MYVGYVLPSINNWRASKILSVVYKFELVRCMYVICVHGGTVP